MTGGVEKNSELSAKCYVRRGGTLCTGKVPLVGPAVHDSAILTAHRMLYYAIRC